MTSTIVRIRTASGVKRMTLQGLLGSLTVGDLKSQIVFDNIFSERGEGFGLKMEGKRKTVSLNELTTTLESLGVVEGTMFTVDFLGGIRAVINKSTEVAKVPEDPFEIQQTQSKVRKVRKVTDNSDVAPNKKSKSAAPVTGQFELENDLDMEELVSYFLDNDLGPESTKGLGSFFFNQFTTAARIDALTAGKVCIETIYNDAHRGASISSSDRSINGYSVSFQSVAGKSYKETCNFFSEQDIMQLMALTLKRLSTKRRKNISSVRSMFSVTSLASRAPWVLWPLVSTYGPKYLDCQHAIDALLDRAFAEEQNTGVEGRAAPH